MSTTTVSLPFPVIVSRENKWFVASCPILDNGTQDRTEKEAKDNMVDLINEYLADRDTPKPNLSDLMSLSLMNVPIRVPEDLFFHGKTPASSESKSH
jgi:predicted RNase H-like HicB family nuclease